MQVSVVKDKRVARLLEIETKWSVGGIHHTRCEGPVLMYAIVAKCA